MIVTRRSVLGRAGAGMIWFAASSSLVWRSAVAAVSPDSFEVPTLDQVVKSLGGSSATESADIELRTPEIAENGAVVPVEITSSLKGTRAIAIVVEKNPHPLSAFFSLPSGTEPYISTRVKVGNSSDVIALVQTDAGFFTARKLVKVTLGGCGG